MASSYYKVKKEQEVLLGYICSKCKNPVLLKATIEVNIIKSYTSHESDAYNEAEREAIGAVNSEIYRINHCVDNRVTLAINPDKEMHEQRKTLQSCSEIRGIVANCPICNHKEPWQNPEAPYSKLAALPKESFPTVYIEADDAYAWAMKAAQDKLEYFNHNEHSNEDINSLIKAIKGPVTECAELELQKRDNSQLVRIREAQQKVKSARERISELGLLDFKERKELTLLIKDETEKIEALSPLAKKTIDELDVQIQKLKYSIRTSILKMYGSTGKIEILSKENAVCFVPEPKPLPIENESASVCEKKQDDIGNAAPDSRQDDVELKQQQKFCRKCGNKLPDDSAFCNKCGTKIVNI